VGPSWLRYESDGVVRPPTVPAGLSGLRDDEEVIGVEVGGRARAYRLEALKDKSGHLVNDVVGGVPVSVAYCDLRDCTRAYTSRRVAGPLPLTLEGLRDGEMVLKANGVLYFHQTGAPVDVVHGGTAFPFDDLPWTRTTWKNWKQRHPETEVYVVVP